MCDRHSRIEFCPLYIAGHLGTGHGCDDGELAGGGCAVDRGMDYNRAIASLSRDEPGIIRECADRENEASWDRTTTAQILWRNMIDAAGGDTNK